MSMNTLFLLFLHCLIVYYFGMSNVIILYGAYLSQLKT